MHCEIPSSYRQLSSLEEREKELLSKVETIRLLKGNLLKAQVDQIDKATRELNGHARALRDFLNSANDLDFIKAKKVLPITPVRAGELIIIPISPFSCIVHRVCSLYLSVL